MKKLIYIVYSVLIVVASACIEDPLDGIEAGEWNNERSVIAIKFENQVGPADIKTKDDGTGEIELTINIADLPDLSAIVLNSLQLSFEGTSSVKEGEALNFENDEKSAQITVTSPTGKSREYIITVTTFEESILGTYFVQDLIVFGGTGPEFGGGSVLAMMDKPWVWSETNGPAAELDNTLKFEMTGITDEGNTFGNIINDPGEDGRYADYQYILDPMTDVNSFYRTIPKTEGTWERNYALDQLIFTFKDGSRVVGQLVGPGTEDLGNDHTKETKELALAFDLNGTDDWDNIYSDYDKFVSKPRRFWIDLRDINSEEEEEEVVLSNERTLIGITFEDQIGQSVISNIDNDNGEVNLTINTSELADLSDIKVASIDLPEKATASLSVGSSVNFENAEKSATLTITSEDGNTKEYKITVDTFTETLLGTYDIANLTVYGGTGPEFGGGEVIVMTDKPWAWLSSGGPEAELDNTLTFALSGVTDEGNTYGTITNDAGADGIYADFFFDLDPNDTDVNHFYRVIPKTGGTWERDYDLNQLTFIFEDDSRVVIEIVEAGTEDLGNSLSKTIAEMAFAVNLTGVDDWVNNFTDFDKIVQNPRRFWIDLEKQ